MEPSLPEEGVWQHQPQGHQREERPRHVGLDVPGGAEGPGTLHAGPLSNWLLLLLAGHAAFTCWVPASEELPRHQAGVGDGGAGRQGTRDPAAGQCSVDEGQPH